MITMNEFIYLVKSWKFNKNKIAARCLICGVLEWWIKEVPRNKRICFSCFMNSNMDF